MVMCAVINCFNNNNRKAKISRKKCRFFSFPRNKAIRDIWVEKCARPFTFNTATATVCWEHFTENDYCLRHKLLNESIRKWRLKPDAIPSVNLPNSSFGTLSAPVTSHPHNVRLQRRKLPEDANVQRTTFVTSTYVPNSENNLEDSAECVETEMKDKIFNMTQTESLNGMAIYQCKYCLFNTMWTFCLHHHIMRHQHVPFNDCTIPLQLYKCYTPNCQFQATKIDIMERHMKSNHYLYDMEGKCNEKPLNNIKNALTSIVKYSRWTCLLKNNDHHCEMYPVKTKSKMNLKKHITETNTSLPDIHECKMCSYKSNRRSNLKKHIIGKHSHSVWYKCSECVYQTKWKESLKQHVLVKHFDLSDLEWYECKTCSYKSKIKSNLQRHVRRNHSDAEWSTCMECGYKTKWKKNFEQHVLAKHSKSSDIEWYECEICAYKTKFQSYLKRHFLVKHSNSSDIQHRECEVCSYKSRWKSNLRKHVLWKHSSPSEIKWYECEMCSYKAKSRRHLGRHVLGKHSSLSDIQWYNCEMCSHRSKWKAGLKRHVLAKHTNSAKIE